MVGSDPKSSRCTFPATSTPVTLSTPRYTCTIHMPGQHGQHAQSQAFPTRWEIHIRADIPSWTLKMQLHKPACEGLAPRQAPAS